jgi:uncharacterized protein (TIGR03382 family)
MLVHLLSVLLTLPAALADDEVDSIIDPAAVLDVTRAGFSALGPLVPAVVPEYIDIPGMSEMGSSCWLIGNHWYGYSMWNMWAGLDITEISLIPSDGQIELEAQMLVSINDPSDAFKLRTELACIRDTCDGYVDPFDANFSTWIAMELLEEGAVDATVGDIDFSFDLSGDDIELSGCAISVINEVFEFFGGSLYDLILPLASDAIADAIVDLGPDLEALLEDALSQTSIEQTLELGESEIDLSLQLSAITIDPNGLRMELSGEASAEQHACVPEMVQTAQATPSAPAITVLPEDGTEHHIGIFVGNDFIDQLLFAVFKSGGLCMQIEENLLNTSMLEVLAGGALDDIFDAPAPVSITTRPRIPPRSDLVGTSQVNIAIDNFGLDFYAEVDYRTAKTLGVGLDLNIGADIELEPSTGVLGVAIDISNDNFTTNVTYNPFAPGAEAVIEEQFGTVVETILPMFISSAIGDLSFPLPGFGGIGISSLLVEAAGDDEDFLGLYTWLGEVPYGSSELGGCDGDSGCGGGCEGAGCGAVGGPLGLPVFFVFVALLRRRQHD